MTSLVAGVAEHGQRRRALLKCMIASGAYPVGVRGFKSHPPHFEGDCSTVMTRYLEYLLTKKTLKHATIKRKVKTIKSLLKHGIDLANPAIQSINYYVELAVISPNILIGETEGLALFVWANPYSIFIALEALGYGFMSLATLFVAPIFTKGKLERSIRWLFIVNGVIGIAGIIGYALNIGYMVILGGLLAWDILFPITTALLAVLFRRIRRTV